MKLRIAAIAAASGVLGWALFATVSANGPGAASGGGIGRIDMAAFEKEYEAGRVAVLDVRGQEAYENGHIPGSLSVPVSALEQKKGELAALGKPIVTYCS